MSWPWSQLGLPGPSDLSEIRHAYAEKLKATHPEEDPEGFQRLHSAYQMASRIARQQKRQIPRPEPEHPPQPVPEPPNPPDFDYGELLQGGDEPPRSASEEGKAGRGEPPQNDGEQPGRPQEREPDWDYDRLFAEGEAERAEYRRRRGEERRREQSQERRRQWDRREEQLSSQFRQEQERWQDTETILHIIEVMYHSQAGTEAWKGFFFSPLFQQNRNSLDLIFGLEDFISGKEVSQEVKVVLFLAYGFDKGVSQPEQRPLFQMLLPAWKSERKSRTFPWKSMLLGYLGSLVFLFGIGPLLDSGLIPVVLSAAALAFIVWVLWKVVVLGSREGRVRGRYIKQERRKLILLIVCVTVMFIWMSWIRSGSGISWSNLTPVKDPREQVCRYMREDLGVEVGSLYNQSDSYATETYSNVFYLESNPVTHRFLAGPDGERDIKNGRTGYTTNLPEMMMLWALKDFAYERKIYNVDTIDREQQLERWETGGIFVLTLPESGGEEIITGLGALLEELALEPWYQAQTPACEVVLCSGQMMEGRLILDRWHPADGAFDTEGLQELYASTFSHSYCAQLIKELSLDWDFIREEGGHYTLTNEGMAMIRDQDCCKLYGLDGTGSVAMEYYVDLEERNIYCLPGNFWETGNSEDQLSFYRLLHWGDGLGVFHLFYPWLRAT